MKIAKSINRSVARIVRTSSFAAALMAGLISCDEAEYLNKIPPTQLSEQFIFDTPARIEGLANGMYSQLKSSSLYGGRYLFFMDVGGEDFINTTSNSFTGYDAWMHTYNAGHADVVGVWSAAYTTINRANLLIEGLAGTTVVTDEVAKQYIGEAKFLRALSYYSLVTSFGRPYLDGNGSTKAVPLRLLAEVSTSNNDLARSTVSEVYAQIIKDLDEAETTLPATRATDLLRATRANKNTAIALKTRVYLAMGNWAKVVQEAVKIVPQTAAPFSSTSGVTHRLTTGALESFVASTTTAETILTMPFTNLDILSGQSSLGYIYNGNAEYYLNPNGILGQAQFAKTDARYGFFRLNTTNGRYYLSKFGRNAPFLVFMPIIRYAEILLNYAEAAAETGNLTLAANLLKAVHARSDASYVFPAATLATSAELVKAIEFERRIELLGEGFRSNDIMRRMKPFPAKSGQLSANQVLPTEANYIWPISASEVATNKLISE